MTHRAHLAPSRERHLVGRSVVIVVSLAMLLAGCGTSKTSSSSTSSSTTASSTTTADPTDSSTSTSAPSTAPSDAPAKAGDCLEPMTQPIAEGHQLPAIVACSEPHGGEVVSVLVMSGGSSAPYPASGPRLAGADAQVARCAGSDEEDGEFGAFVGANSLRLTKEQTEATGVAQAWSVSGIQVASFVPGPGAWGRGERWFVCAAVLTNSFDAPTTYAGSLRGTRSQFGSLPEQLSWCKLQSSSDRNDFVATTCGKPHNYEQLVTFLAPGAEPADYPGEQALNHLSETLCGPLASQATKGRSDHMPKGIGLGWTYPIESEWGNGNRSVRCFAVTENAKSTGTVGMGTAKLVA